MLLAVWFFVTESRLITEVLFPSPLKVLRGFIETLTTGYKSHTLFEHIGDSFRRLFLAYALAAISAVLLGLASGYNRVVRAIVDPLVEFYQSIPPLAYFTLLIIWLGIGDASKIALLFLAAFAPVFIASMSGVKAVREDYIHGAFSLGAGKLQVFIHVIVPACLPYIFTGLRTAMATAYGTLVAAEMVAAVSGIGWLVFDASRFLRTDLVFMGIVTMGLTSLILDRCIRFAESRAVPWKGKE
jgi:taurine transport system permease protein